MKLSKLLPIAVLVLMAINATGMLRAVHMLSAHAPASIELAHSDHDGIHDHHDHGHTAPDDDLPAPAPSDDDHDCDLCFSLRSMHEIVPSAPLEIAENSLISPTIPHPVIVVRVCTRPAAHPARGPPVC